MIISLPNGKKLNLEENISMAKKLIKVNELILEWEHSFERGWTDGVVFFISGLANYLVWHKEIEDKGTEDKEVLSIWKIEEMEGLRTSICTPFTYLSYSQKEAIGEDENNEYK